MGILDGSEPLDHNELQIETHQEQLAEQQAELDKLDGVDTPNAELRRKELRAEMRQTAINIHQLRDQAEKAGHEIKSYEKDISLFRE